METAIVMAAYLIYRGQVTAAIIGRGDIQVTNLPNGAIISLVFIAYIIIGVVKAFTG